jgi:hypothetical protein
MEEVRQLNADLNMHTNLIKGADLENTAGADWISPVQSKNLVRTEWNDERIIWAAQSKEDNTKHCYDNQVHTHMITIDPYASYEAGIWIKSTGKDMNNYHGFYLFDENKVQIEGDDDEYGACRWRSREDGIRSQDCWLEANHKPSHCTDDVAGGWY